MGFSSAGARVHPCLISGPAMFAVAAGLYLVAVMQTRRLAGGHPGGDQDRALTETSVLAGIRYIRSNRVLLSLISLDLFAVLLGGVTAPLPIYFKDIPGVGLSGLGYLRGAPGVGAAIIGLVLAHRTIKRGAGKLMLGCVAGFGLATVVLVGAGEPCAPEETPAHKRLALQNYSSLIEVTFNVSPSTFPLTFTRR